MKSRSETVEIALFYVGAKKGSAKHKELVKLFNSVKPHGEVAKTSYPWCAIKVSAVQIKAGNQSIAPLSMSCNKIIAYAKQMGIWEESDSYVPSIGDYILYDWDDSGKGNNTGSPDHVGMVYSVDDKYIYVVEGNKGTTGACGKRAVAINGKFIRGFVHINYPESEKEVKAEVKTETRLKVDGSWGRKTTTYAQKKFKTKVDGIVSGQSTADKPYLIAIETTSWDFASRGGSSLIKAIQKKVGVTADGYCGPTTIKYLQKHLKKLGYYKGNIDGYLGSMTVTAFQKFLNEDFVLTN